MQRQIFFVGILAAGVLFSQAAGAHGDEDYDYPSTGNSVEIEEASATPAKQGEPTTIRFILSNGSSARVHLSGLRTEVADEARLMARTGARETSDIGSIGVDSGETLDLTGAQLWYETSPVKRDLATGDTINVTLDFVTWRLTVPVRVYDATYDP